MAMFSISVCTSFLYRFGGGDEQSIPYSGEEEKVRSTSTDHASPLARVLGTFSHTTYLPISCARWACFLDRSVAVNVSRSSAPFGLDLRDVFAYDLLPVQLHPLRGSLYGQVSSGQRQPITLRRWLAFLGRFRIRLVTRSASPLRGSLYGQVSKKG